MVDVAGRAEGDVDLVRSGVLRVIVDPHVCDRGFAARASTSDAPPRLPAACAGRAAPGPCGCGRRPAASCRRSRAASSSGSTAVGPIATSRVGRFCAGQRAAAHLRDAVDRPSPPRRRPLPDRLRRCARPARPMSGKSARSSIRSVGTSPKRLRLVEEQRERRLQSRQGELVRRGRCGPAGFLRTASNQSARPRMIPPCAGADQLVGAGSDQVGPRPQRFLQRRLSRRSRIGEKSTRAPAPTSSISDDSAGVGDLRPIRPAAPRP